MKSLRSLKLFLSGLLAPLAGLRHLFRHPRLWRHVLTPVALNLLLTAALAVGLAMAAPRGWDWLNAHLGAGGWWQALKWLTVLSAALLSLGLLAASFVLMQGVLCAGFYGALAMDVELSLGADKAALRETPFIVEILGGLAALLKILAVSAACMAVGWIPPLAPMAAGAAAYFSAMTFGQDYLSYPLSLRGMAPRERSAYAKAHRAATLGLGSGVMILVWIPLLNSLLLATAVAGSVLLHRKLEGKGERTPNQLTP